jgi:hypothetical protein
VEYENISKFLSSTSKVIYCIHEFNNDDKCRFLVMVIDVKYLEQFKQIYDEIKIVSNNVNFLNSLKNEILPSLEMKIQHLRYCYVVGCIVIAFAVLIYQKLQIFQLKEKLWKKIENGMISLCCAKGGIKLFKTFRN